MIERFLGSQNPFESQIALAARAAPLVPFANWLDGLGVKGLLVFKQSLPTLDAAEPFGSCSGWGRL
jgi:hypothetical protein